MPPAATTAAAQECKAFTKNSPKEYSTHVAGLYGR
jgi:hypothetical protein